MRSFLLVLVTALGVLGPGCTCAGRDPGATTTSEASAPEGGAGASATPAEATSGATARLERKRPMLRGPLNPTTTRLRPRPGLTRGLNGRMPQVPAAASDAPPAAEAPAP